MKPRTAIEKKVYSMKDKFPAITEKQMDWGRENCFWHRGRETKNHILCHDCGTRFKKRELLTGEKCPSCKRSLKIEKDLSRKFYSSALLRIIDTYDGFQVIRYFWVSKYHKLGELPQFSVFREVIQNWISPDGKRVTIACLQKHSYGYYTNYWFGDMSVRYFQRELYEPCAITYPKKNYLPQLTYGRKLPTNGWPYFVFLSVVIHPEAETIYKAGYKELYYELPDRMQQVKRLWPAIKICIRNGYKIKDPTLWLDYVDCLRFFKKDIRNRHYVCPDDLLKSYERWYAKKRAILDKKNLIERTKRNERAERSYQRKIEPFRDLTINDGDIIIKPLMSVMDVMKEGDSLKHCVHEKGYHKKPGSLLLTARKDGKPYETIEYSLENKKVIQCRGRKNYPTSDNERIINLVNTRLAALLNDKRA